MSVYDFFLYFVCKSPHNQNLLSKLLKFIKLGNMLNLYYKHGKENNSKIGNLQIVGNGVS